MTETAVAKKPEKLTAKFQSAATLEEYLAFVTKVAEQNEKASSKTCQYMGCAIFGFFSFFLGIFSTIAFPVLGLIAVPIALFGLGSFFYLIYKVVSLDDLVPDQRFLNVKTILEVLAGDLAPGQQLNLDINSFGATHSSKCTDEQYRGAPYLPNRGTFNFADPWLEMSFKTRDGCAVKLSVEERTRQRRKPKRKGRWKAKNKIVHRFKIKMDVSPRFYRGWVSDFSDIIGADLGDVTISQATLDGYKAQILATATGALDPVTPILRLLSVLSGQLIPVNSKRLARRLAK